MHRVEAVDVDADMVVVDVPKLGVLDGVELDSEEVVANAAIVGVIDKAQELDGESGGEIGARGDEEGEAMAPYVAERRVNTEHKGDREGSHRAVGSLTEAHRRRVERVAFDPERLVGQLDEAARHDCGCAVEGEVAAVEAGVDESLMVPVGGYNVKAKAYDQDQGGRQSC